MRFTIWQRKPEWLSRPLAQEVEVFEVHLVHWTGPGEKRGTECRTVTIAVNAEGGVSVEQSTSEMSGTGLDPEYATRVYLPGWQD